MLDVQAHWVQCVIIKDVDGVVNRPAIEGQEKPCFETLMAQFTQVCAAPLPEPLAFLSQRYKHHDPRIVTVRADLVENFEDLCRRAGRMVLVCEAA